MAAAHEIFKRLTLFNHPIYSAPLKNTISWLLMAFSSQTYCISIFRCNTLLGSTCVTILQGYAVGGAGFDQ